MKPGVRNTESKGLKLKKKWGAPGTDVCSRTGTEKARVGEEVGLGLERWAGTSAHRMPLPM